MKYLLFIVLLVAVLITTGCVSNTKNTVVTPTPQIIFETVKVTQTVTQTPTPTIVQPQDPIIGVWRENYSYGYDDRYRFNADGTFVETFYLGNENKTLLIHGTWRAEGSNSYTLRDTRNIVYNTFIYDPEQNAIYPLKNSISLLTPYAGDVMGT